MPPKARAWCVTIQVPVELDNYDSLLAPIVKDTEYSIFQLERAPTTGQLHLQGYMRFKNARAFNSVRALHNGMHIEAAKGSVADNITYCSKSDSRVSGPWSTGIPPAQGMWCAPQCAHAVHMVALPVRNVWIRHHHF
jgi:hypothetical protein